VREDAAAAELPEIIEVAKRPLEIPPDAAGLQERNPPT